MELQRVKRRRIVVDDSALANRIGERIRLARRQAGLTQQQLAEGRYTKAYISALEKGHAKPSMAALNFISQRLGLPASRFLADSSGMWDRLTADLALASADWSTAAAAYESLLDSATDRGLRAETLLGLAQARTKLERADLAVAPATEALEIFTALGRADDANLATFWVAVANLQLDNRVEARALLVDLLGALRKRPPHDSELRLRALSALGRIEESDAQHRRAVACFEEAAALSGDVDLRRRAGFLQVAAVAQRESGDIEGAIRLGRESITYFRAADAQFEAALLENQLALAYLSNGNLSRAKALAGHARTRYALAGDDRVLAHVAETQARIAIAEGQHGDAIVLGHESRDLATRTGNPNTASSAMLTIARAQAGAGDTEAAIRSYQTSVGELRERGPAMRLQQSLGEWAELLATAGRHEEAYALTREALMAAAAPSPSQPAPTRRARVTHSAQANGTGTPRVVAAPRSRAKARVS